MTTVRVTTFNVNQFSKPAHQEADLLERMAESDVVLCQETVDLDLMAFADKVPGWSGFQVRHGDNDGHANTGVLWRTELGEPLDVETAFLGDVDGTRARYLTAIELGEVWYAAGHIFPSRDKAGIPQQLANLKKWVESVPRKGKRTVIGFDRNQCTPGALEQATGLRWVGIGIDGFLTNCRIANLAEFPKGFSDHPGVHATVTIPGTSEDKPVKKKTPFQTLIAALRRAVASFKAKGKKGRADQAQSALDALKKKPARKLVPAPDPYAKTTRDGKTIDQLTNYALYATERRLKYTPGSLTVVQGSYNAGGVSASAGTHDGGGVIDLTAADWENKVHALRAVGFAAWHRPFNWDNAGGGEHIHAVLIGNAKLSPSAARQVTQYRNHTNGLANFGPDNTWHPNPIPTFRMPKTAQEETP